MKIEVTQVPADDITPLRELYRHEMRCQIIHDSFARRDFSHSYLVRVEGRIAAYGLVAHKHYPETVHEFYVAPSYRAEALPLFREFLAAGEAKRIRAQSNDRLLTLLLYEFAAEIAPDANLFEDGTATHLSCPDGVLRRVEEADKERISQQKLDDGAEWMIEADGIPVATGGVLFHYNPPFGDLYMAVHEGYRRRGYGSYLIQELRRIAYEKGKVPAARCNASNVASRRTLLKGGMRQCGRMLEGAVAL
jgi:GNAT superfamily N-acetyltransferase